MTPSDDCCYRGCENCETYHRKDGDVSNRKKAQIMSPEAFDEIVRPLLEQAVAEGYAEGFKKGFEQGKLEAGKPVQKLVLPS